MTTSRIVQIPATSGGANHQEHSFDRLYDDDCCYCPPVKTDCCEVCIPQCLTVNLSPGGPFLIHFNDASEMWRGMGEACKYLVELKCECDDDDCEHVGNCGWKMRVSCENGSFTNWTCAHTVSCDRYDVQLAFRFDPPPSCECQSGVPLEAVVELPPEDQDCCAVCCCPDPMPNELVLTFVGYGPDSCSGSSGGGNCDGLIGQEISLNKVGVRIWEGTESLACAPYGSVSLFARLRCIPEVCPPGTGVPVWVLHIHAVGGSCLNPQQMGFTDYSQPGQDPITTGSTCYPFSAEYRLMVQGTSEVPPDPTCCCIANTTCDIFVEITDPNPPDPCP